MKRNIYVVLIALIFLFAGLQTAFSQEAVSPDRGSGVTVEALPEELKGLDIKDYFISSDAKEAGVIQTMIGHVVVIHEDSGKAYFAAPGDKIFEKNTIFTLKESRCRLKFLDDNLITMGDDTKISIKEFIVDVELKEKRSVLSMVRGKAMFYALKLFKYRKATMLVETPTAVAGVRGTKFGVEIKEEHSGSTASRPVYLADASETGWVRLAQTGSDSTTTVGSYTVVYCFDGTVTVTSTVTGESVTLLADEFVNMFTTGAGEVSPTPEGLSRLFQDDTSAPEGDEGDEGDEGAGDAGGDEGGDTGGGDQGGDAAQTQTGQDIDDQGSDDNGEARPATHYGYYTGMLERSGSRTYVTTHISTSRQDFDSADVRADEVGGSEHSTYVEMDGTTSPKTIKEWVLFYSGDLWPDDTSHFPKEISRTETSHTEYMEWGYWTKPNPMLTDEGTYYFANRGYYVWGDYTKDMPEDGEYIYSGPAYGTFWTGCGGDNMTGTFNANVNFAASSNQITDFDMSVSGDNYSASITNATGTLGSSHFSLSGGTWELGPIGSETLAHTSKSAYGSFYGTDAAAMGGVWEMGYGGFDYHAVGSFAGNKEGEIGP